MVYQAGAAMLDAFVLSIISRNDTYGYQICQEIKETVNLKESSLYPMLKRLQVAGYLETYDQPYQGRNRRYYKITEMGEQKKAFYVEEWDQYKSDVDRILKSAERSGHESS